MTLKTQRNCWLAGSFVFILSFAYYFKNNSPLCWFQLTVAILFYLNGYLRNSKLKKQKK